jgi:hypothetical protein
MSAQQFSDFKMKGMKFQYLLTSVVATGLGLAILLFPEITLKLFMMKPQDHIVYGISGSVYLAFGLLSMLGIKDQVTWLPILLLQFLYKVIWFVLVVGRSIVLGQLDILSSAWLIAGYAVFVAGDIWAIPFGYFTGMIFRKRSDAA